MSHISGVRAGDLMVQGNSSIDPRNYPSEVFDLLSIPAFDVGEPEVTPGSGIGSSKQLVRPDDILISKIVPHIRRAWVVGANRGRRQIASGEWIVFRSERVFPRYLRHALVSDGFHAQFMQTVSGVGGSLLRARPAHVGKIEIPIPPLPEQRRIAEVLDRAETLRAQRRQAFAQLDALAEAIFLDMFGEPATNPKGWPVSSIAGIAEQVTDGEHLTPKREKSGVKLLSARNVRDGYLDFADVDYIGADEFRRISRRCNPSCGDVLISCSGTIGRVAAIELDEPLALVRSVALVRPRLDLVETKFLEYYLRSPTLKARMLRRANASSQANLFQNQIRELPVFLPPLSLQQTFKSRLESLRATRSKMDRAKVELDALFASLQHRAFCGEL